MKIEVWFDYVCPFCFMGKAKLEKALDQFEHKDQVEVEYKAFQLAPDAELYSGQNFLEDMAEQYGGLEKTKEMMGGLAKKAKLDGLNIDFETVKETNSLDAHRLTKFAETHDKEFDLANKIFNGYFSNGQDIGDVETLTQFAIDVGLNEAEVRAVLNNKDQYADEVRADRKVGEELGVRKVPTIFFNREFTLPGVQVTEDIIETLDKAWQKQNE